MEELMKQITQLGIGIGIITVIITLVIFVATIAFSIWILRYVRRNFLAGTADVLAQGMVAQATILKAWQTGVIVNYNPQIGLLLQVQPPDGHTYQVETKAVVPQLKLSMLQEGALVPVKVDPNDRNRVALALN